MKKVLVIGASVAGLSTALEILKQYPQPIDVTVVDKKRYIGERTICGGAISSFMLRELKLEIPQAFIAAKIKSVRIYSPNGNYWEISSYGKETYGYILWRESFEKELARQVGEMGGTIRMRYMVKNLNLDADIIIGADGLLGETSKLLGLPDKEDIHIAVQRIALLKHPKDRIDLYFGSEFAPKGYAWIFPEGNRRVRIGLGVPLSEKVNPNRLLDKFMSYVGAVPISKPKAKMIPTAPPPKKLVFGRVALVGDAGRLCDPATGGGIANAILSGKYVAKAIAQGNLSKYDDYCRKIKRRNLYRYRLKRVLYNLSDEDFNEMIITMRHFKPKLTRISWALVYALITLAMKKPKLFTKHKILRRLMGFA